jgi:hypothetical protein
MYDECPYSMNPFSNTCEDWDLNSPDQMFTRPNYVITQSSFDNMTMNDLRMYGQHAINNMQEKIHNGQYSVEQKGVISSAMAKIKSFFKNDGTVDAPKMERYFLDEFQQAEFSLMPKDYQVVPYFNEENKVLNEQINNEASFDVVSYVQLGTELTANEKSSLVNQSQAATGEVKPNRTPLYIGAAALAYMLFK